MAAANHTSRLIALRKILAMEAANGFQDQAVQGGLDRFLATMRSDTAHPAVRSLEDRGMLSVEYRALDEPRRQRWTEEVEHLLAPYAPASPPSRRAAARRPPPGLAPPSRPAPPATLDSPASALRSVTRTHILRLAKLGVETVHDLVFLFPNRHLDYSKRRTVAEVRPGEEQTIVVGLWSAREIHLGRGGRLRATEAVVGDETGNLRAVWFGQPWLAATLRRGLERAEREATGEVRLVLSGRVTVFSGRQQMDSPEWEVLEDPETAASVHTGRLVPVYPSTEGLPARTIRRMVREALDVAFGPLADLKVAQARAVLPDPLPDGVCERHGLMPLADAVLQAHYPDNEDTKEEARRRLAFDELLTLLLAIGAHRQSPAGEARGVVVRPRPEVLASFLGSLPFDLTEGQRLALGEALADISRGGAPMSRLLQGDVGSGKTVVALALLLTAVADGYQGAMMAPTEVLAEQHFLSIERLLGGLAHPVRENNWFSVDVDGHPRPINVGLLTGSTRAKAKRELHARALDGSLDIIVGTHALIQGDVALPRLALAVVDEQHRFGVVQRAALRRKGSGPEAADSGEPKPHLLAMSATPIPRTLQLTLYGDLEVSIIRELPAGRAPVQTRMVPPDRRADAERFLVAQAAKGRQSFVVCPLIDESETVLARAATEEFERLRSGPLSSVRVGLLHGRMGIAEKQEVMDAFRDHEIDVLVATTVIEVGIDIPNATVMFIEGAERFGLSQLHQLRGRVGRAGHQSYCLLLPDALGDDARQRLEVLVNSNDGFEIAEADLALRGSGDMFGTRQSGLTTLRMARLSDRDLLASAREEARDLLAADPQLREHEELGATMRRYMTRVVDEVG